MVLMMRMAVTPMFPANDSTPVSADSVTYEPGARSAWHPAGQQLIVQGGSVVEIRAGDVVWCPPDARHWPGATPASAMTHIAITGVKEGRNGDGAFRRTSFARRREGTDDAEERRPRKRRAGARAVPAGFTGRSVEAPEFVATRTQHRDAGSADRTQPDAEMPHYVNIALDQGVKPREISEIITHLAFYAGQANAVSASAAARDVFARRKIGADQFPAASPLPIALDEAAEAKRVENIRQQFGAVAPALVQYTTDVLFRDLWLRPDLAPRHCSLVTVSALVANGQAAQIPYHVNWTWTTGRRRRRQPRSSTHLAF